MDDKVETLADITGFPKSKCRTLLEKADGSMPGAIELAFSEPDDEIRAGLRYQGVGQVLKFDICLHLSVVCLGQHDSK